ncbi:hypothetical protein KHQ86_gp174 [Gordonia phage Stormageddon]|uniref:Uncharacterized protein n=1 Tax=Gordonia phage Stormageddon TaxID=2656541 RepID=A0A649VR90_9CAUD|nr:hypothetical protein KHQ86_gp174 [Gordonia phage Stormageddon]QGJ94986.1 hypothetical protein SEA_STORMAGEDDON_126 [Gordonia phage Stormageddon]
MSKAAGVALGTVVSLTWGPVLAMFAVLALCIAVSTVAVWREGQ